LGGFLASLAGIPAMIAERWGDKTPEEIKAVAVQPCPDNLHAAMRECRVIMGLEQHGNLTFVVDAIKWLTKWSEIELSYAADGGWWVSGVGCYAAASKLEWVMVKAVYAVHNHRQDKVHYRDDNQRFTYDPYAPITITKY
tara:strand:- start:23614 stop:24033 length:420 start_codon:yes stop_codon:yes gene_type:complete